MKYKVGDKFKYTSGDIVTITRVGSKVYGVKWETGLENEWTHKAFETWVCFTPIQSELTFEVGKKYVIRKPGHLGVDWVLIKSIGSTLLAGSYNNGQPAARNLDGRLDEGHNGPLDLVAEYQTASEIKNIDFDTNNHKFTCPPGLEDCLPTPFSEPEPPCTCKSWDIARIGCTCAYAAWNQRRMKEQK